MGQIARVAFASKVTVAMGFAALVYFRLGVNQLFPLAKNSHSGPFTPGVEAAEFVVPIAIAVIILASWAWVLVAPVQEERTVRTVRRP